MRDPSTATERVGRYQLLDPIGSGPCGSVSRAKVFGVAGFERQFALKRFLPELTQAPAAAQALSTAARQYGGLEHPRIARMAEFGVAQGQTYTAVELVAGLDLMRLVAEVQLAGGTLAAGGSLALISQAARAVGYAHGRGLSHLGLAPTNLICTADGDVKVTDFGILAATMPPRPAESPRLVNRLGYLAPEQIAGEAVSAATDVFVLGVIGYELVTGHRAFSGDGAQQIARAILAGPPPDPSLPRPIVRVLQRCLARSPFERFPDARALADALDAALRVAPVPGTRKDIGAQVKLVLDRLAQLNESAMSGVVALNMGTGPRPPDAVEVRTLGREIPDQAPTSEYRKPDMNVPLPPGYDSPAITKPDLPKPMTTVPGLAPPPIPVPPGISLPPSPPATTPPPGMHGTMLGMPAARKPTVPQIPPIKPKPPAPGPSIPTPPPLPAPPSLPAIEALAPDGDARADSRAETRAGTDDGAVEMVVEAPSTAFEVPTRVATEVPKIAQTMQQRHGESDDQLLMAIEDEQDDSQAYETRTVVGDEVALHELANSQTTASGDNPLRGLTDDGLRGATIFGHEPARANTPMQRPTAEIPPAARDALGEASMRPTSEIAPAMADAWRPQRATSEPTPTYQAAARTQAIRTGEPAPRKRTWPLFVVALVAIAGLGVGAWQLWLRQHQDDGAQVAAAGSGSASRGSASGSGAIVANTGSGTLVATTGSAAENGSGTLVAMTAAQSGSGTLVAMAGSAHAGSATVENGSAHTENGSADLASGSAGSASSITKQSPTPAAPSDQLQISSKPSGARVFIDGAEQGATPVKLPGSADRHTVALLLPGHELYTAEVDGHGTFNITLTPVTPTGGPAGIKVIKCKAKSRYYVYVDGKATGMTCPTERIETSKGPHTVEVYDIVTETPRKFEINVTDTRLSYRVRIE